MGGFDYLSKISTSISNLWEMGGEMYDSKKLRNFADAQA